jgi:hypothetical protein
MQHHVEVRCRISISRLMEDALVHDPCPAKSQQDSTCEQEDTHLDCYMRETAGCQGQKMQINYSCL